MLYSMTGYGQKSMTIEGFDLRAEIKTLNSRNLDIRAKLPVGFREMEMKIRSLLKESCQRGKIDFTLSIEGDNTDESYHINKTILSQYYHDLKSLSDELGFPFSDPASALVRLPNACLPEKFILNKALKEGVERLVKECLTELNSFRSTEGQAMAKELLQYVHNIEDFRKKSMQLSDRRIVKMREKFTKSLEALDLKIDVDNNRLEQELIFYIEKMDFAEETSRLKQHCSYFVEILENNELCKGRKLNFISQEMGREINTLGSKANDAEIQRFVVGMKDELEKIKEQTANIL